MSISVIGSGAFGTALAISLAQNGPVCLWSRSSDQANAIQTTRENKLRLSGVLLPDQITVTAEMRTAAQSDVLLIAVPMQQLRSFLKANALSIRAKTLVACCKGIELGTGIGPVAVIQSEIPDAKVALLTGPSFAIDIAHGLPTALSLACSDATLGKHLQQSLNTANLRLYRTTDVVGAEVGGALKNVIAIGCGAVIGAGLGGSARAALMTRGYAEMQRMALALKSRPETLAGLSGFGDLALTCTSDHSRNYRLGLTIGAGTHFDGNLTVEGAATARAVAARARQMDLDMPICNSVVSLLDRTLTVREVMAQLLARPLKEE